MNLTISSRQTGKPVAAFAKSAKPAPSLPAADEGVRSQILTKRSESHFMKSIDDELNEIVYASDRGAGFGGGAEQERELDKRVQVLMHRQNLEVKKKDTYIAAFNVILAFFNIALLVYQVFFVK